MLSVDLSACTNSVCTSHFSIVWMPQTRGGSSAVFAGIDRVCVYVCMCRKNCVQEAGETDSHCDADSDGRYRGTIRD